MEMAIIFTIVLILGFFLWRSAVSNKKRSDEHGSGNPNPNAPTSSRRL